MAMEGRRRAIRLGRRALLRAGVALPLLAAAPATPPPPARRISARLGGRGDAFRLGCHGGALTSLRFAGDRYETDYVRPGAGLGHAHLRFRRGAGEAWRPLSTRGGAVTLRPGALRVTAAADGLALASAWRLEGATLRWTITLANQGADPVEIGDLFLPMPMATDFAQAPSPLAAVMKHSFVSGHGSHIFWMRSNSAGPYLLLLPERDTALEYWSVQPAAPGETESWCAYLHAAAAEGEARAGGTRWRLPVSALTLAPGARRRYGFRLQWVADYAAARAAIAEAGLIDVELAPGMTIPRDLEVELALRSADPIAAITAEHAGSTRITPLPPRAGYQRYRIGFARLGENRLTLHQSGGRATHLEFFATEPLETMIAKRGAFLAAHQHRDPTRWYYGLLGEWAMDRQRLLGPDDYDRIRGWRIYEVTCDDPGLAKPAFLATKNAEHPVAAEVAALDLYIDHFLWGGLQQTEAEPYPFALYGIPDWKQLRDSADPGPKGRSHVWRPYDYPHIMVLYFGMYRIARDHPGIATRHPASLYLARAYGTAMAMFSVPLRLADWSAYRTGFYNECVIPELVAALEAAGQTREAAALEAHWARKVRTFASPDTDLFGSEYPFDSTGFESTQALARAAVDRPAAMGVTPAAARAFRDRQIAANLFCRGWLEPAYYYLGSDYRAGAGDSYTLTYMAQMGGWAVLDYALNDAEDPHALLRLGYASQLSAWALLNSGAAADGHGYWYPGAGNDGAAAGGFEPAPFGTTWLGQPHHRGAWYYACEIDLGFTGALRAARTILADDPILGRLCYGGALAADGPALDWRPSDGVRRRLALRLADGGADLRLLDARFAADRLVRYDSARGQLDFIAERFAPGTSLRAERRCGRGPWQACEVPIDARGGASIDLPLGA
ncbi:DUF5695 domain-containing protein [Sphingomonas morindae]|uniref:DUF5695 domain-containing protein n=1 Tax=Sphingomonas morindae TaxID=1541170 RepID=A0ABY4X7G1_9SPHN|nr:DUF5695 domain-containing protein [Sphingomonas morindae]USI72560.1 DUF5695 domain-containing protein [Sphingomonas morindae]